jgi:hypothetical protein
MWCLATSFLFVPFVWFVDKFFRQSISLRAR